MIIRLKGNKLKESTVIWSVGRVGHQRRPNRYSSLPGISQTAIAEADSVECGSMAHVWQIAKYTTRELLRDHLGKRFILQM